MQTSPLTAREMYEALKREPNRRPFGFGQKAALVNVDLQCAYTRTDRYKTAYGNHPEQFDWVNRLAQACRARGWPVVWSSLAFMPDGSDAGVWGTRSDTPDSLQNMGFESDRAQIDGRAQVDAQRDMLVVKKAPSVFHGTHLLPYLVSQRVDTVIVTGGSTSGCVRATVVDSLSNGLRTIVAEECVADVHESPHFASLYDMQAKYADVLPAQAVLDWLGEHA